MTDEDDGSKWAGAYEAEWRDAEAEWRKTGKPHALNSLYQESKVSGPQPPSDLRVVELTTSEWYGATVHPEKGRSAIDVIAKRRFERLAPLQNQRQTRTKLSGDVLKAALEEWMSQNPGGGKIKQEDFEKRFQALTNCHRSSAEAAYRLLPAERRNVRGRPRQ